jgi:hypothetical protein
MADPIVIAGGTQKFFRAVVTDANDVAISDAKVTWGTPKAGGTLVTDPIDSAVEDYTAPKAVVTDTIAFSVDADPTIGASQDLSVVAGAPAKAAIVEVSQPVAPQ